MLACLYALQVVNRLRISFNSHKTKPVEYRIAQLKSLMKLLEDNKESILKALHKDLQRVILCDLL